MEIVIDIPEEDFENIKLVAEMQKEEAGLLIMPHSYTFIANGVPLPKGHGRLIDADAVKTSYGLERSTKYGNESKEQLEHSYDTMMLYEIADMLDYAPTIIEADKENRHGDSN